LSGIAATYKATSVNLIHTKGDIIIDVHCANLICLISTSSIADAIAAQFVPSFTNAILQVVNSVAAKYFTGVSTVYPIPGFDVLLKLNGGIAMFPKAISKKSTATPTGNLVIYAEGTFVPQNSTTKTPPFTATVIPPDTIFTSPQNQLSVTYTNYFLQCLIWAMGQNGELKTTYTNDDLAPDSAVHLVTTDPTLLKAIPGLASYPNMQIVADIDIDKQISETITTAGFTLANQFAIQFSLYNATTKHAGWVLQLQFTFDLTYTSKITGTGVDSLQMIYFTSAFGGFVINTTVISSSVGAVSAPAFNQIIANLAGGFSGSGFLVPVPAVGALLGGSSQTFSAGYGEWLSTMQYYLPPAQELVCPGGTKICPLDTTCCQWPTGMGCCVLPSATCCATGGCCPHGSSCGKGECISFDGVRVSNLSYDLKE